MKVALVHELLTIKGGAERVLRVFAEMFPEAPIYTLLYDEKKLGQWFPKERVRTSRLQKYAALSTNHHLYLKFSPAAVEAWDFSEYDLVISSSSAFAHGIITNSHPPHLCYVHSPARYLWDRTHDVLARAGKGIVGMPRRAMLSSLFHKLRVWDSEAADRPDRLLAASGTVQRRIELYWRRESDKLHPPIDDFWFTLPPKKSSRGSHYVIVSTLAQYKRIDLAIHACNALQKKLIIAGDGPAKKSLQAIAGPSIEFVGHLEGEELRTLYSEARATLFPGEEDFGLVPLESLSCGTPVIAYGKGGATETIESEKTGLFFTEPTAESLESAIQNFEKKIFDPHLCIKAASHHRKEPFQKKIQTIVQEMLHTRTTHNADVGASARHPPSSCRSGSRTTVGQAGGE